MQGLGGNREGGAKTSEKTRIGIPLGRSEEAEKQNKGRGVEAIPLLSFSAPEERNLNSVFRFLRFSAPEERNLNSASPLLRSRRAE